MRINHIKSTDYNIINGVLKVVFADTSLDELQTLDQTLVVETDTGELVETLTGWQAAKINYDLESKTYEVEFSLVFKDEVIKGLESKLASANNEIISLRKESKTLESAVLELAELIGNTGGVPDARAM